MFTIQPYILGSGNAAQAMRDAWAILSARDADDQVKPPIQLKRGERLQSLKLTKNSVLCIANPPGLHADAIAAGENAKFDFIVCEKPACISVAEAQRLRTISVPVSVCHGYRQTWGVQTLRKMIMSGELGEIITIEGRYWQSSTAQRAMAQPTEKVWKDNSDLSGPFDTLLDVGVHWVDAAVFISGAKILNSNLWVSYVNSGASHRDSHVQLQANLSTGSTLFSSISKTVHGAPNHFEINVIGSKKSASWKFLEPDQIEIGIGSNRQILARKKNELPAIYSPFHGAGWVEGYFHILQESVKSIKGEKSEYPTLSEHLFVIETLLNSKIEKLGITPK